MSYEFQDWGLINYEEALKKQEQLVEDVASQNRPGVLVFCQHPAIVTLGRSTQNGDVTTWAGPILEVSRGGRATYHGPSQLVIYPVINLNLASPHRPAKDVTAFLRQFENAIVESLKAYNIQAQGRSLQKKKETEAGADETGVWVGSQKLASLGIAVRKWTTYHGAAINVHQDPMAFQGLNPCGFQPSVMICLEKLVCKPIDTQELKNHLKKYLMEMI